MSDEEAEIKNLRSQIEQHEERISTLEKQISKLIEGQEQSEEDAIISSQSMSRLERDN